MDLPERTPAVGKLAPGVGHVGIRDQPVRRPDSGEVVLEVIATGMSDAACALP